jgi:hypothetical protein
VTDAGGSIIEAIRSAFAGVPPGRITVHEAEVIDGYGSDAEREEARRLDTEESWDLVPDQHIEDCPSALCHLDPEGWRYYLPAYMIWSLRHFRSSDSIVSDFTIYTFDFGGTSTRVQDYLREYKEARFRLLSEAQSWAVCRFLRYMAANEDYADASVANQALDDIWGRFCDHADVG